MSVPNWREVFARALYVADGPNEAMETVQRQHPTRLVPLDYDPRAAAILAAIAERGYRLYRDHDMKYHSLPAGQSPYFRCSRCGHRDSDLGMPTISCDGPE